MKTKYFFLAAAAVAITLPAVAQETYENAKIINDDLNGTARYVGMGGATDALGADISTISTNPAGVGLFRHNKADVTVGMVSQQDAADYTHGDATNLSFDQIGFVWTKQTGDNSFLNVAFNYHKRKNLDFILSADDKLNNASQNKLSYMKLYNNLLYSNNFDGTFNIDKSLVTCNQLDDIFTRNLFYAAGDGNAYYYDATAYDFDRAHKGYIGEYDFNVSGNIDERLYLGLTIGLHDVHYRHISDYTEDMVANPEDINILNVYDERKISGSGVDVKLGAILRPIEYAPLLIGVSVATPTWYDLTTSNYTEVSDGSYTAWTSEEYDYKLYSPWKFGASIGYTIGNKAALAASYEFADYGHTDSRVVDGGSYGIYDYYESSSSDKNMNRHTKSTLKGVSTLKLGAEFKPISELALRVGYNYVSSMYDKTGFKDGTVESFGSYYASSTDYTNWKDTNRFTVGLGWKLGAKTNLDLAYQYSTTKGDFYPFMGYVDNQYEDFDINVNPVEVFNKRHQVVCTLGYTF